MLQPRLAGVRTRSAAPLKPPASSSVTTWSVISITRSTNVAVWGPNEAKLRAGDLVEVLDEQSTLFALLYLVEHVPAKFIRFAELIKASLGGVAIGRIEARGNHYAQWRGPAKRWCIIGPTGTVVRDGILSKEEAERDVTTRNLPTSMAFVSHPRM